MENTQIPGNKIRSKALELGFSFCGFAKAQALDHEREFFTSYLGEKRNAGLHYLEKAPDKRTDPTLVFEGAQTVIGLLLNYFPPKSLPGEDNFIVSKYGYGKDYHLVLKDRANSLIQFMNEEYPPSKAKVFVDSGPVLEKAWARYCGLGWNGKNTLLITPSKGSFFFIAIILTNLIIEPDLPETDHCGKCHLCMDACPTHALDIPYVLNPSRCIAYLTIHEKNEIPEEFRTKLGNRIYGCDTCQDVCPYNRFATPHSIPEFIPNEQLAKMNKEAWLNLTPSDFDLLFRNSAIYRIGYDKMMKNISDASG